MNSNSPFADPKKLSGMASLAQLLGAINGGNDNPTGGLLQGVGTGAELGASFGPLGAGIGAGLGGIAGLISGFGEERAQRIQKQRDAMANNYSNMRNNTETDEEAMGSGKGYYATGGLLRRAYQTSGGQFKSLSDHSMEVQGASHEDGGVDVPGTNAVVEGGETISGDYVFSKRLGFASEHKMLMTAMGKIEGKPPTPERINSMRDILKRQDQLKMKQELLKRALYGNSQANGQTPAPVQADGNTSPGAYGG